MNTALLIMPSLLGQRKYEALSADRTVTTFTVRLKTRELIESSCECGSSSCPHLAAALDIVNCEPARSQGF